MNLELPLDRTGRDALSVPSRALFQSQYALEVLLVIGQNERFYAGQVADLSGCQPNYARDLIGRLQVAGLVEALENEPGQVRKYFRRLPSPIWDAAVAWARALLADRDGNQLTDLSARRVDQAGA